MKNKAYMLLSGMVCLGLAPAIQAGPISFTSLTCFNATTPGACTSGNDNIWNTGDFLSETFTGTGLSSISQLALSLNLLNSLAPAQSETWNITVNSTLVGSLTETGPANTTYTNTFSFASVAGIGSGQDYAIKFTVASPGVPVGNGTLGLLSGSTGNLSGGSAVPEPSTISMVGFAIAGLGLRLRKRQRP